MTKKKNAKTTSPVRKAVIPVAGFGTRFLPVTKAMPKEMLPVIDVPSVQLSVEEVVAAGITDITLVTGMSKRAIEDHFDRNFELEYRLKQSGKNAILEELHRITEVANFTYVRQKSPRGIADALLAAEHAIGDEPFVFVYPDDLIVSKTNPIRDMIRVYEEYNGCVVGVLKVPKNDVSKYGIIKNKHIKDNVHEVLDQIEKPSVEKAPSQLASLKGFVLTPMIFGYIHTLKPGVGGELVLFDAVRDMNKEHAVFACEFNGELYDLGAKLGWLKANVMMGLKHPDIRTDFKRYLKTLDL